MADELPDLFHFDNTRPNFEAFARENGFRYWLASDLAQALGLPGAHSLKKAIERASQALLRLDVPVVENFDTVIGEDGTKDWRLSRFACYLTVMNADPSKKAVAQAQTWFAVLAEAWRLAAVEADSVERLAIRGEVSERERALSHTAHQHGVESYQLFQNAGYRGLYNMNISELRKRRTLPEGRSLLDFMGKTELAANLFRITQTDEKIRQEGIKGQRPLERAAEGVGRRVRQAILDISSTRPEDLPITYDIKDVQKELKQVRRDLTKLDKPKKPPRK
ncbi:hypothetical protein [Elioraea sp.]|uniref:hypothetical protein n=1 Tax=Elioraea sp. TaxID=2185103 RepID=UPI0025B9952A|nr:hypothetical protein [Elioraea sp.]